MGVESYIISTILLSVIISIMSASAAYSDNDRIRLSDVNALTLVAGKMTTSRRSYAVPQLKCTGGSAGCGSYEPRTVQCYNRGSNGIDVQWECKADLDSDVQFGNVEVVCEGYEHADDPYILKGSCGLEYSLDYTKQGMANQKGSSWFGSSKSNYDYSYKKRMSSSYQWGDLLMVAICAAIGYAIYTTCVADNNGADRQAPPPEYRQDYNSAPPPSYAHATHGRNTYGTHNSNGGGGGGFWTGAGLGGLFGYMMGNRGGYGNRGYGYGNQGYGYGRGGGFGSGWGSGWGGTTHQSAPRWTSSSGSGGSTRVASGFGGTRRR